MHSLSELPRRRAAAIGRRHGDGDGACRPDSSESSQLHPSQIAYTIVPCSRLQEARWKQQRHSGHFRPQKTRLETE
eukprot:5623602-Prymnesium_polylepis.2